MLKNKQEIKEVKQKVAGYPHKNRKKLSSVLSSFAFLRLSSCFSC